MTSSRSSGQIWNPAQRAKELPPESRMQSRVFCGASDIAMQKDSRHAAVESGRLNLMKKVLVIACVYYNAGKEHLRAKNARSLNF